jgi:hypothetical protein
MWHGREVLEELQRLSGVNTDVYGYKNCKINNSSLVHGIALYNIGVRKFLGNSIISRIEKQADKIHSLADLRKALEPDTETGKGEWVDLAGLIAPRSEVSCLLDELEQNKLSLADVRQRFAQMHANYYTYEWTWAADRIAQVIGHPIDEITLEEALRIVDEWQKAVVDLDHMVYDDARKEFDLNSQTGFGVDGDASQQRADFESVRGSFDSNTFVNAVLEHIRKKSALGEKIRTLLKGLR